MAVTALLAQVSTIQAILIGVASGLVVLLVGAITLASLRRPRRRRREVDIPAGMQPGPSDADLEQPVLVKAYIWGALLIIVMALWIPGVWLREPATNAADLEELKARSDERGHLTTLQGSEENELGFDCERCHGPGLRGGQNFFEGNLVPVPSLIDVCQRLTVDQIAEVIAQGRPGTDMPSWSVRFAGAMHDQQIQDLVNYIISIQDVPDEQNLCLGEVAAGPEEDATVTPQPTPEPTP